MHPIDFAFLMSAIPCGNGIRGLELSIVAFDLLGDTLHHTEVDWRQLELEDEAALLTRTDAVTLDRSFTSHHSLSIGAALVVDPPTR
jgi:hypothetical protein